jgi:hypothetical protein
MPEVFGGQENVFEDLDEAQAVVPELMALYNGIAASVASEPRCPRTPVPTEGPRQPRCRPAAVAPPRASSA